MIGVTLTVMRLSVALYCELWPANRRSGRPV